MRKIGHIKERHNRFTLYYRNEYLGTYATREEAEEHRLQLMEKHEPVNAVEYIPLFAERLNLAIGKSNRSVRSICKQADIHPSSIGHYVE